MNRSNVGNIVTNAVQTLSIGATTAGAMLKRARDRADRNLNDQQEHSAQSHLSDTRQQIEDERLKQAQMRTQNMEMRQKDLTSKIDARNALAEQRRQKTQQSVDDIMSQGSVANEQDDNIRLKVANDMDWVEGRAYRKLGNTDFIVPNTARRDK